MNPNLDTRLRTVRLTPDSVRAYHRTVQAVLIEAVNHHGVQFRHLDSTHIRLYTGDRSDRPFKVSASRTPEYTLRRLVPWLDSHFQSYADRDRKVTPDDLEALAETLSTTKHQPKMKETQQESTMPAVLDTWTDYIPSSGKDYNFETNSNGLYRCKEKDCGHTQISPMGMHFHHANHQGTLGDIVAKSVKAKAANRAKRLRAQAREEAKAAKAAEVVETSVEPTAEPTPTPKAADAELAKQQKQVHLAEAVKVLAEHLGITIGDPEEIQRLHDEVAELKVERDDLQARLVLIKEAMNT